MTRIVLSSRGVRALCLLIVSVGLMQVGAELSKQQKQQLLDAHNYLRSKVALQKEAGQPGAANMVAMEWDEEAARIAQSWTDQCIYDHDPKEDRHYGKFTDVGQNWAGAYGFSMLYMVKRWYNEVKDYTFSPPTCSGICGHYKQIVWAESNRLGCGLTNCRKGGQGYSVNMVCNYAPGGNYKGMTPYKSGSACSSCPTTHRYCSKGLCAASPATVIPTSWEQVNN